VYYNINPHKSLVQYQKKKLDSFAAEAGNNSQRPADEKTFAESSYAFPRVLGGIAYPGVRTPRSPKLKPYGQPGGS
jgi:hypothetical protein